MEDTQTLALAKVIKNDVVKKASGNLDPGSYEVDFIANIRGTLKKGEDHKANATAKIDFRTLALVALSKVNSTTRNIIVQDFLAATKAGKDSPERTVLLDQVKDQVMPGLTEIANSTMITKQGTVTTTLVAAIVTTKINARMDVD